MHIHIDLIAGLPFEDLNSFINSFNIAFSLRPNILQLGFLKLLHGSVMREEPENFKCKFSDIPPYEVTSTPWLSENDLAGITSVEDLLERLYNSGRFEYTLEYLMNNLNLSAYELFKGFADTLPKHIENIPLDKYTEYFYNHFARVTDKDILRDKIVKDRISTNASGVLPKFLRIRDENLKKYRKYLNETPETAEQEGIKRGIAILYTENSVIYADYDTRNPVAKKFQTHLLSADLFSFS